MPARPILGGRGWAKKKPQPQADPRFRAVVTGSPRPRPSLPTLPTPSRSLASSCEDATAATVPPCVCVGGGGEFLVPSALCPLPSPPPPHRPMHCADCKPRPHFFLWCLPAQFWFRLTEGAPLGECHRRFPPLRPIAAVVLRWVVISPPPASRGVTSVFPNPSPSHWEPSGRCRCPPFPERETDRGRLS